MISVANKYNRLPNKEWVLGVTIGESTRAYPFRELKNLEGPVKDQISGTNVIVEFDEAHQTALALDANGKPLDAVQLYWFAWAAFHPDTSIWKSNSDEPANR